MDVIIKEFDRFLRWAEGVYEYCDQPHCLLRLKRSYAKRTIVLTDKLIEKGAPILELHLWNEHIPQMPKNGPDLSWALLTKNWLIDSFRSLGTLLMQDVSYSDIEALSGVTVLAVDPQSSQPINLFKRLGFEVYPYSNRLGRFGEFWENFYTWGIMWAFNKGSLQRRKLVKLRRSEIWISIERFNCLYLGRGG